MLGSNHSLTDDLEYFRIFARAGSEDAVCLRVRPSHQNGTDSLERRIDSARCYRSVGLRL